MEPFITAYVSKGKEQKEKIYRCVAFKEKRRNMPLSLRIILKRKTKISSQVYHCVAFKKKRKKIINLLFSLMKPAHDRSGDQNPISFKKFSL
jgi:hypothetical protein